MRTDSPDMRKRLAELFGSNDYLVDRVKMAFDRQQTSAEDIVSGRSVPAEVLWLVEMLEACPQHLWPERWLRVCDGGPSGPTGGVRIAFSRLRAAEQALRNGGTNGEAAVAMGVNRSEIERLQRQGRLPRSSVPRGRPRK